jgi:hypothetical protein
MTSLQWQKNKVKTYIEAYHVAIIYYGNKKKQSWNLIIMAYYNSFTMVKEQRWAMNYCNSFTMANEQCWSLKQFIQIPSQWQKNKVKAFYYDLCYESFTKWQKNGRVKAFNTYQNN